LIKAETNFKSFRSGQHTLGFPPYIKIKVSLALKMMKSSALLCVGDRKDFAGLRKSL